MTYSDMSSHFGQKFYGYIYTYEDKSAGNQTIDAPYQKNVVIPIESDSYVNMFKADSTNTIDEGILVMSQLL